MSDERWALPAEFRDGAHARVYRATDVTGAIKGRVAVKVLPASIRGDSVLASQVFDREYQSLMRLKHPNIVSLIDGGRDSQTNERYFVFPWLEQDLASFLGERPPEGWDDFYACCGKGILSGLVYAHSQHVAHRDVKPQNILVDPDGRPRLADFGIAKIISRIAPELTLRDHATRPYAPPEYDDGTHTTQRDVHAYAVLTMLAITHVDPFSGYDDDPYRAISDALNTLDVPERIHELLSRCVHSDPDARPHDAFALQGKLQVIEGARAAARPKPRAPRAHLMLAPKTCETLMDHLDLDTDLQVSEALVADLADESVLLSWDRETFEDGGSTDGHYYLIGSELRVHVLIADGRDHLVAVNVWPVRSSLLERERERGWQPPWEWEIGRPGDVATGIETIATLEREVSRHVAEEQQRRRRAARERPIQIWRRTLAAKRALVRDEQAPVHYHSWHLTDQGVVFELADEPTDELLGELRLAPCEDNRDLLGEVIAIGPDTLTLSPLRGAQRDGVRQRGPQARHGRQPDRTEPPGPGTRRAPVRPRVAHRPARAADGSLHCPATGPGERYQLAPRSRQAEAERGSRRALRARCPAHRGSTRDRKDHVDNRADPAAPGALSRRADPRLLPDQRGP